MPYELSGVTVDLSEVPEAARDAAFAAIETAHETAVGGLVRKRDELLARQKDLQTQLREAGNGGNSDKLYAQINELQDKLTEAEAAVGKAEHERGVAIKRADAAEQKAGEAVAAHDSLVVDSGLKSALAEVGVTNPALLEGSRALLTNGVKIAEDGTLTMEDKPLAEALKEWAGGDTGKAFVSAANNAGGSAGGNTGGNASGHDGPNPFAKDTYNLTQQIAIQNSNPELAKTLQESAA